MIRPNSLSEHEIFLQMFITTKVPKVPYGNPVIWVCVVSGMIMSISQSLTDNFNKQAHTMLDYVFMRLLSMKMGLFSSYR